MTGESAHPVLQSDCYQSVEPAALRPLLTGQQSLDEWFTRDVKVMKETQKLSAHLIRVDGVRYFVKRYKNKQLMGVAISNKALAVYERSLYLQRCGLPIAAPLAYIKDGAAAVNGYFVSEALEDMTDLRHLSDAEDFAELIGRDDFLLAISTAIAKMHELGYCHGDLKWANIMVNPQTALFKLIDLDGLSKPCLFRESYFVKDLARFILNAREKRISESRIMAFVNHYADQRKLDATPLKRSIERVFKKLLNRHKKKYGVNL